MYRVLLLFMIITILSAGILSAQEGVIKGYLVDAQTKTPLAGANIKIVDTSLGAACDENGRFIIPRIPVGAYALEFSYIGYQSMIKTDIIVRPARITTVEMELQPALLETETISVAAAYFAEIADQPVSTVNFAAEEIRRAPGSAGDVSRIVMGLPSLAKVNDQSNSLIVRGGSPTENAFYIDNIEIPNINHFPTQGASGGPIGLLNVDLIKDVNFNTGGFNACYGNRLSSVMEISLREGNRDEFDGQADLNFAGFGTVLEGPLPGIDGSWLLSARRSYLDLLVKAADIGSSVAPRYGDIQAKFVFELNANHQLTWLGIFGDDHNNPDRSVALENDMIVYGSQDIYENTTGLNWRAIWSKNFYSRSSISFTSTRFKEDFYETASTRHLLQNRSLEQAFKFRSINHWQLSDNYAVEAGIEAKRIYHQVDNFFAEYTDALGNEVPYFAFSGKNNATQSGIFLNLEAGLTSHLKTNIGLRADYFSYTENISLSPRLSLKFHINDRTSFSAATGVYYQNLPLILLDQHPSNRNLKEPQAIHYVLGFEHILSANTRFTTEVYLKEYNHFPIDPAQPALFVIDELFYRYGFFFNHNPLTDQGHARSSGIELMIQKKLAKDFYGMATAAYFKSEYSGSDGVWRDRVFDNRFIFSLEGGYKPNAKWEFSMRWIYAGGTPYTPFDQEASQNLNRAVLDESRINQARYPAYHSLNVRFDRRFHYENTNLIFYLSVWNAYNRKNVASYFWNENENRIDVMYQWSLLPIFGLEYEF